MSGNVQQPGCAQEAVSGQQHGLLLGAARLGDRASIGNGYWMSAHGGAVRSLDSFNADRLSQSRLNNFALIISGVADLSLHASDFPLTFWSPLDISVLQVIESQSIPSRMWADLACMCIQACKCGHIDPVPDTELMQVESILDEATAELGKMDFSPMLSTIEADFKIKKSVPLHTTLSVECEVIS
jgi:hypothetical protein